MQAREEAESEVRVAKESPDETKGPLAPVEVLSGHQHKLIFSTLLQPEKKQPFVEIDWLLWYHLQGSFLVLGI